MILVERRYTTNASADLGGRIAATVEYSPEERRHDANGKFKHSS